MRKSAASMEEENLCDVCRKRQATRCQTIIFDDVEVVEKLCDDCVTCAPRPSPYPDLAAPQNEAYGWPRELRGR